MLFKPLIEKFKLIVAEIHELKNFMFSFELFRRKLEISTEISSFDGSSKQEIFKIEIKK